MRSIMHVVAVALIYSLLQTVTSDDLLGFEVYKFFGDVAQLTCTVKGNKTEVLANAYWQKTDSNGSVIYNVTSTYDRHVVWFDEYSISLGIKDLEETDSGWYECKVFFNETNTMNSVNVKLIVEPNPHLPTAFQRLRSELITSWKRFMYSIISAFRELYLKEIDYETHDI
nr:PREDICTED: uncharacterized protein LOC105673086 [Linepithema humile]